MEQVSHTDIDLEVILREYDVLRAEILQMEQMQSSMLTLQFTAVAAIFSFSLSSHSRTGLLLILPILSYALCRRYLAINQATYKLSTYIAQELSPRVHGGFGWEAWNRKQTYYHGHPQRLRIRHALSNLIDPISLSCPWMSVAALAWSVPYILFQPHLSELTRLMLAVVWFVGLIFSFVSLYMLKRWRALIRLQRRRNQGPQNPTQN
jgi:hypothetical protein